MLRWLAAAAWTAILLAASSDLFSASHTGGLLRHLLGGLSPAAFDAVHMALRKIGHLVAYGIASVLYLRALRGGVDGAPVARAPRSRSTARWQPLAAVAMVLLVASIDELHQSTIPSRTGSPVDVLIDVTGATIAQLLTGMEWRRRQNC